MYTIGKRSLQRCSNRKEKCEAALSVGFCDFTAVKRTPVRPDKIVDKF